MSTNEQYQLSLSAEEIDKRLSNSVLATEQELTDEEQIQARKNISSMLLGEGEPGFWAPPGTLYMDKIDGSLYKRAAYKTSDEDYDHFWAPIFVDTHFDIGPNTVDIMLTETESGMSCSCRENFGLDNVTMMVKNSSAHMTAVGTLWVNNVNTQSHVVLRLTAYNWENGKCTSASFTSDIVDNMIFQLNIHEDSRSMVILQPHTDTLVES